MAYVSHHLLNPLFHAEPLNPLPSYVWLGQRRWLQLGSFSGGAGCWAGSSLPQGDPISPYALVLFLNSAATDVATMGLKQSLFLDDRILVASTVPRLLAGWRRWGWWSRHLGLCENDDKRVALAQSDGHRHAFLRAGFRADQVKHQIRILGVDFVVPGRGGPGDTSLQRFEESIILVARLARAGVGVDLRRRLFSSRVVSKLCWGWWLQGFEKSRRHSFFQLYRTVGAVQQQSAVPLRLILDGHQLCPQFRAVSQAVSELGVAARAGLTWQRPLNAWASAVHKQLGAWGWQGAGPWQWRHSVAGHINVRDDAKGLVQHALRESWRAFQWQSFTRADRRDSRTLRDVQYEPDRLKLAMNLFQKGGQDERAVLTGAALSEHFTVLL